MNQTPLCSMDFKFHRFSFEGALCPQPINQCGEGLKPVETEVETLDGCPYYKVVSHLSGNVDFANISNKLEVSVAKSAYMVTIYAKWTRLSLQNMSHVKSAIYKTLTGDSVKSPIEDQAPLL